MNGLDNDHERPPSFRWPFPQTNADLEELLDFCADQPGKLAFDPATAPADAVERLEACLQHRTWGAAAANGLLSLNPDAAYRAVRRRLRRIPKRIYLENRFDALTGLFDAAAHLGPAEMREEVTRLSKHPDSSVVVLANAVLGRWGDNQASLLLIERCRKVRDAKGRGVVLAFLLCVGWMVSILSFSSAFVFLAMSVGVFIFVSAVSPGYRRLVRVSNRSLILLNEPRAIGVLAQAERGRSAREPGGETTTALLALLPQVTEANQFALPLGEIIALNELVWRRHPKLAEPTAKALLLIGDETSYRVLSEATELPGVSDGLPTMRDRLDRIADVNVLLRATEDEASALLRPAGSADGPPNELLRSGDQ